MSSIGSNFIIYGDLNVNFDVQCCDRSRFKDILQCRNMVQGFTGPTYILGHTLDIEHLGKCI